MIRTCEGSDPNLTRDMPAGEYDPARYALSPWDAAARPGQRVIQCDCGLTFDDVGRMVTHPHLPLTPTVRI